MICAYEAPSGVFFALNRLSLGFANSDSADFIEILRFFRHWNANTIVANPRINYVDF